MRGAGARVSARVTERGDSTLGRSRAAAPLPCGLPGGRSPWTRPGPPAQPHRTQWRPELPPPRPRAACAPPARAAFPGPRTKEARGFLGAPRGRQVPAPSDPAPARLRAPRPRREQGGAPTARGLCAAGARARRHLLSRWSRAAGAPAACRGPPHPSETPAGSPPGPRWFSWATPAPPR